MHRDIKPANILIGGSFKNGKAKYYIADFGISVLLANPEEKLNDVMGSDCFIAPEVLHRRPYNFSADVWSMGILLFELLFDGFPYIKDEEIMTS